MDQLTSALKLPCVTLLSIPLIAVSLFGALTLGTAVAHAAHSATAKAKAANPKPEIPAPIRHAPGATNLDPGLNTNPKNDPAPAAFQYGTGTDPFDGETGDGSGPEGTRRTAAIHDAYLQTLAAKAPKAAAAALPPGELQPARAKSVTSQKTAPISAQAAH